MSMRHVIWGILIISISTGPIFNMFGEKAILVLVVLACIELGSVRIDTHLLVAALFFSVFIVVKSIGVNLTLTNDYHGLWGKYVRIIELIMLLPLANCMVNDERVNQYNFIKRCYKFFNIFYYFTIFITIIFLIKNGQGYYRNHNVINPILAPQFFLLYSIALGGILAYKIIGDKKNRLQNLIKLLANFTFVYLMNYTTQIFFFLFAVVVGGGAMLMQDCTKRVFVVVMAGLMLTVLMPNLSVILRTLNERLFSHNVDVYMRLDEIVKFLTDGDLSGIAFGGRVQVMNISINSFKAHPLIGIPFASYNLEEFSRIGGHHEWADDLALFGIIGFFLFFMFIFIGIKGLVLIKGKERYLNILIMLMFVMFGFYDPIINLPFIIVAVICRFGLMDLQSENSVIISNNDGGKLYNAVFTKD